MSSQRRDITPLRLDEIPWTAATYVDSIHKLADAVRTKAQEAIEWYAVAKQPKRTGATIIRALTIFSTTSAGILTVLQIYTGEAATLKLEPIWISLALAISAALLGVDRFFGFSRAWIRYVAASLKIQTALNQFNMSWPLRMADWSDGVPNPAQVKEAITECTRLVCHTFVFRLWTVWSTGELSFTSSTCQKTTLSPTFCIL